MRMERVETLIIGGGQAGLAMSHMLARLGLPHLVLERNGVAERWRSERWDGLRFQFPNWSVSLPEFPYPHTDPDGFATARQILDYIRAYASFVGPPIRCGVSVETVRPDADGAGFVAESSMGLITARNVVVATGPYQRPIIPAAAAQLDVFQVHASRYRSPDALPEGGVLVVGSGASGAQIAEELARAGREVHLAVGRHRRMPRRYRGRDLTWWLGELGLDRLTPERRGPDPGLPLITGAYGGHTIDFREFARQGIVLTGKVVRAAAGRVEFSADLGASITAGDTAYLEFLNRVDAHIRNRGLSMPVEPEARKFAAPESLPLPPRHLDLAKRGVAGIVWATGYTADLSWIDLPVFDTQGSPMHRCGISPVPGLYFLGLPWLSRMTSSFLSGVGEDAEHLAAHIAARSAANA
jgi:putative flavoprotein involved in K+ transport